MIEIKEIMNTNAFVIIAFITTVFSAISLPLIMFRFIKKLTKPFSQKKAQRITLMVAIVLALLFFPVFLLVKSFDWTGWQFWLTQVLSYFVLLNFIGLCFFILKTQKILNQKH